MRTALAVLLIASIASADPAVEEDRPRAGRIATIICAAIGVAIVGFAVAVVGLVTALIVGLKSEL